MGNGRCYNRCNSPLEPCCTETLTTDSYNEKKGLAKVLEIQSSIPAGKNLFGFNGASSSSSHRPGNGFIDWDPLEGQIEASSSEAVLSLDDGTSYVGQVSQGRRHGHGEWRSDSEHYVGQWTNDVRHGDGQISWNDGRNYRGQLHMGMIHGMGRMEWPTPQGNMVFEGEYVNQLRHGAGRYIWNDGRIYTGTWVRGKRWGKGTFSKANGETRQGVWKYSRGEGSVTDSPCKVGESSYEGSPRSEDPEEFPKQEFTTASWESTATMLNLEEVKAYDKVEDAALSQDTDAIPVTPQKQVKQRVSVSPDVEVKEIEGEKSADSQRKERPHIHDSPITARQLAKKEAHKHHPKKQDEALERKAADESPDASSPSCRDSNDLRHTESGTQLLRLNSVDPVADQPSNKKASLSRALSNAPFTVRLAIPTAAGTEEIIKLQVSNFQTADQLRKKLKSHNPGGVDLDNYILTLKGDTLDGGETLGFLGLKEGDIISLKRPDAAFGFA